MSSARFCLMNWTSKAYSYQQKVTDQVKPVIRVSLCCYVHVATQMQPAVGVCLV